MVRRLEFNTVAWWAFYTRSRALTPAGLKCIRWHVSFLTAPTIDAIEAWARGSELRYQAARFAIAYAFASFTQGFDRTSRQYLRVRMRVSMATSRGIAVTDTPWFRGTGNRGNPFG